MTLSRPQITSLKIGVNAILKQRAKFAFDANLYKAGSGGAYSQRAAMEYDKLTAAAYVINQIIKEAEGEQKTGG